MFLLDFGTELLSGMTAHMGMVPSAFSECLLKYTHIGSPCALSSSRDTAGLRGVPVVILGTVWRTMWEVGC